MLINSLRLENIKSYKDATIRFNPGINAISGENGSGKTTIKEAIGYALFDTVPYTQEEFLKHGETKGCVTVEFLAKDERLYRVVRKVGVSDYYVYDVETEQKICEGKQDVLDWLKANLGSDLKIELNSVFENAVGAEQGEIITPFLLANTQRKNIFDPMLGVDSYRNAYDYMRDTAREISNRKHETDKKLVEFETKIGAIDQVLIDKEDKEKHVVELSEGLIRVKEQFVLIEDRKKKLTEKKNKIEEIRNLIKSFEEQKFMLNKRLSDVIEGIERAKAAKVITDQTRNDKERYELEKKRLEEKELKQKEFWKLKEERIEKESKLNNLKENITKIEGDLKKTENAEEEIVRLKDLHQVYEQYDNKLKQLKEKIAPKAMLEQKIEKLVKDIETMETKVTGLRANLEDYHSVKKNSEELEIMKIELDKAKTEKLRADIAINTLNNDMKSISVNVCPFLRASCEQLKANPGYINLMNSNLRELEEVQRQATLRLDSLQKKFRESEVAVMRMSGLEKERIELAELSIKLQNMIAERKKDSEQLNEILKDEGVYNKYLEEFNTLNRNGDIKEKYVEIKTLNSKRSEMERDKQSLLVYQTNVTEELQVLSGKISTFGDIEKEIAEIKSEIARLEESYKKYISNFEEAKMLEDREKKGSELKIELEGNGKKLDKKRVELEAETKDFDVNEIAEVEKKYISFREEIAKNNSLIEEKKKDIEKLLGKIKEIEAFKVEFEKEKKKKDKALELEKMCVFTRNMLKTAAPYITDAYLMNISNEANRIFCDLTGRSDRNLTWDNSYEIKIREKAIEKRFKQLSGGEQMASALSVRLALLKSLSGIDIAFFDEPTQNLDEFRRYNLAKSLPKVKGFKQMFVISHDDTFDQITENVVFVKKKGTESYIEY